MQISKNVKIIPIMQRTLNFVDQRLVDHGIRVAYLMYQVLRLQNKYSEQELRDFCLLGMLHDIGAFKTEEIDKMVIFETIDVWDHSIYGYLFLKYFSPLESLAPVILYHHATCAEVAGIDPLHRELAQLISLCDRADVYLHHSKNVEGFFSYIEQQRDIKFCKTAVDNFIAAEINLHAIMDELESDKEFLSVFYDTKLTMEDIDKYLRMVIYSIDFRCSQTVIHSITVASIARILAKLSGIDDNEIEKINTSAMLQGIGKIGDNDNINLEKKDYTDLTEVILSGNVDDDILRVAVKRYKDKNEILNLHDRILAVADIISALCFVKGHYVAYQKEKVGVVLKDMCRDKLLDSKIVSLALDNLNNIIDEVSMESQSIIGYYDKINEEYKQIKSKTAK